MALPTGPCIIQMPKITDPRGNLTFAEGGGVCPFEIRRVYWIYDVPAGEWRGGHSHHETLQLLVAVSGSFDVNVTDGFKQLKFTLNRPFEGLFIPRGIWRTMDNFASGSVCLSIVSTHYSEEDYVREYEQYVQLAEKRGPII